MALSKSEKTTMAGIVIAVVVVAAFFGVQSVMRQMQDQRVREEKKALDVSVGMGEPIQLDSAVDTRPLEDGTSYSAALCFEGKASVTVQSAKLYNSKEKIDALTGDSAWQGARDTTDVSAYLVCSVTFDNADAVPDVVSEGGRPVFNAGIFNVNHGGEIAWIGAPFDRSSHHDALSFDVPEGKSLTFDMVFAFYENVSPDDLQMWLGTKASVKRYRCELTVDDCRE
ncbi:MAG: hypothetical protein Q4B77_03675 [Coriobacteriaceae bacterium]|nr:hypothetical protein [Coriobacteriaceae bacterium]